MSNTLITAGLVAAEKLISKSLEFDPGTAQAIKRLAPQVLKLNLHSPSLVVFIRFADDGIELLQHFEDEVTAELSGSWVALARVFASNAHNLKDSGVRLEGKAGFIADVRSLVQQVELDWEEMLSLLLGDILGPKIYSGIRTQIGWTQDRTANIARLSEEFLTHESGLVLSKPELENFYRDVQSLALKAEQLKLRFERL